MWRMNFRNGLNDLFSKAWTISLAVLATAIILPTQALAQNTCPANLEVDFNGDGPFYVGDDIPIKLTLNVGQIQGGNYVDINHFQYLLDCGDANSIEECILGDPVGNEVVFNHDTVFTDDCFVPDNPGDLTPDVVADLVTTPDGEIVIDFTVANGSPQAIRIPGADSFGQFNSCEVTFSVTVESLAPENQEREVVQLTGWSGADAQCDNEEQATGVEQSLEIELENPQTIFIVTKDFTDNNPEEVHVFIQCNSGQPNQSDFWITDPATGGTWPYVGFVVTSIPSTGADCIIWEDPVPAGYDVSYLASAEPDAVFTPPLGSEENRCYFDSVLGGTFYCDITNSLKETKVTVNKVWDEEASRHDIPLVADAYWQCFNVRADGAVPLIHKDGYIKFVGETDSYDITGIYPDYAGSTFCTVEEQITQLESAVESDDSDCDEVPVPFDSATTPSCTIYNTVFFEGIPTLSQYGLALMALLMLGVGLLGFRRFI